MDWAALGSREAVLAVCARFRVDFAQAEDCLLARQLGQAEERAEADEQEEEEEEEDDDEGEQEEKGTIMAKGQQWAGYRRAATHQAAVDTISSAG
jgi:hypothetical protein